MNPTSALFKSSSSTRWLARQSRDPFVRSRGGSYRARSAFKLKDLAGKYPILGRRVVDLGAAPGGWSQVAAERQRQYRGKGVVVAVDLLPMEEMKGVEVVTGDFFEPAVQSRVLELLKAAPLAWGKREVGTEEAGEREAVPAEVEAGEGEAAPPVDIGLADCVLSDMMASMSGIRDRDVAASLDLVSAATWLGHQVLRPKDDEYPGGSLVYVPPTIQVLTTA
jgi:23S rRNA (uridine2552-2'-O)-methyltransferase